MAQFKFWNIGDANVEIDKLVARIIQLESELSAAKAVSATNPQIESDLASARKSVSDLTSERDAMSASVKDLESAQAKLIAGHEKALKDLEASVESRASSKALTIIASQGVSVPLQNKADSGVVTGKKDFSDLRGLDRAIAAHEASRNQAR